MYDIKATKQFKKDYKKLSASDRKRTQEVVDLLRSGQALSAKYRDHALSGDLKGIRDCHIKPDLILLYSIENRLNLIKLLRLGNHSNLQLSSFQKNNNNESRVDRIDDLIEDIYNLRKEGMEEDGEYSIKNLIFKEFRNLGYLDNLKELRKKEIGKELSLESLKNK